MKILALVVLLALPSLGEAGVVWRNGNSTGSTPWAVMISTETQYIASASAVQAISFADIPELHGVTRISSTTYATDMAGVYEFCFSGIADNTSGAAAYLGVYLYHNGIVTNSNTVINIPTGPQTSTLAVCLIERMETNGQFRFITHGSETTANWKYIAEGITPVVPATPSVILTVKGIDGD